MICAKHDKSDFSNEKCPVCVWEEKHKNFWVDLKIQQVESASFMESSYFYPISNFSRYPLHLYRSKWM